MIPQSTTLWARSLPRMRRAGGYSLVEVMIAGVLLGLALLSHAASTVSEHRLARQQQVRSEVLHVIRQFMGRLRTDEDWAGLFGRLDAARLAPMRSGDLRLADGRILRPAPAYFPDVTVPEALASLRVHVDVPVVVGILGAGMPMRRDLREDALLPHFGLPADLDGDGVIGADALNDRYNALPVVVTFQWQPTGEAAVEERVATWLRGER